jgi:glutamate synthase domain-containing protein 2
MFFSTLDDWLIFSIEAISYLGIIFLIALYVYDKYIQRKHQLLINYPVIGRMRYLFEALREPLRQYFAEETFYESRDKINWVYKAAKNLSNFTSFSVSQPFKNSRFVIKHSNYVLNNEEILENFQVTIGKKHNKPFVTKSIISRSAMSDGALSPEATRAFVIAAQKEKFPINTGEGGLTSNYFITHHIQDKNSEYLEKIQVESVGIFVFKIMRFFFNKSVAFRTIKKMVLPKNTRNTYIFCDKTYRFFKPNWNAPLEKFPKEVPEDMADIIVQIGSGLYGVRDENGEFNEDRYKKVMSFCKMSEIKIAQGAKQTGGKIIGAKVTPEIAYYRGVKAGEDLISPNRFPYANTEDELFDFIGKLQKLSEKPVGMKIVISDRDATDKLIENIKKRYDSNKAIPDFITVDSGEGGSATAPLELMESVGLAADNALYIVDYMLRKHNIRKEINIVISGKILTPDDVIVKLALGADMVSIARGFMMSAGCIRARHCAGTENKICPVGLATQDAKKRASYLIQKEAKEIANYHRNLLKGIKTVLAVMGLDKCAKLEKKHLAYKTSVGDLYFDVEKHFTNSLHI